MHKDWTTLSMYIGKKQFSTEKSVIINIHPDIFSYREHIVLFLVSLSVLHYTFSKRFGSISITFKYPTF